MKTETTISNEKIVKAISPYIGTFAKIKIIESSELPYYDEDKLYPLDGLMLDFINEIQDIKLILRTINQLTDDELMQVNYIHRDIERMKIHGEKLIQFMRNNIVFLREYAKVFQYLLSIGIDLPNFYLDGKTLIESGLAIRKEETNG